MNAQDQDRMNRLHVRIEEVNLKVNPQGEGLDRVAILEIYDNGLNLWLEVEADVIQIRDIVADAYNAGLLDNQQHPFPAVRQKMENLLPGIDPGVNPGW